MEWLGRYDDYHTGAADSFRHWLLKSHPKLVQFADAIDPIVGGRFIRAMRANLFTWALLPAMHEYIGVYNDSKRGEVNANDLAKAVTVYLDEPHRPAMARATALLYCDLYSPCLRLNFHVSEKKRKEGEKREDCKATARLFRAPLLSKKYSRLGTIGAFTGKSRKNGPNRV